MRQRFLALAAAMAPVLLGGCGSAYSLLPPGIPDGPQLEAYAKTSFAAPHLIGNEPRDTLVIGVAYVDQRCAEFFDAVEQMGRRTELVATGLAATTSQAAIIMSVAERSALEVARVAGALEITRAILAEYREQYTFAPHSSQLRSLVLQAMTAQRMKFGEVVERGGQFSQIEAIAAVKKYAENCTLGAIREHWNNAIAKAVQEGVQPDVPAAAKTTRSGTLGLMGRSSPPANILSVNRYVVR